MQTYTSIYEYITKQETAYRLPINITEGWEWNMYDHVRQSFFYKFGRLLRGNSDYKPVKNIVRWILNLRYRAEDIDVKDIVLYIDDEEKNHLSFLVKKYHDDVFVVENDLDTFWDEVKEEKIDYGGAIIERTNDPKPKIIPLKSLVFADQTNILSGVICIKHYFSPDELLDMEQYGWGNTKNGATATLEQVITLAEDIKRDENKNQSKIPGKYIEVYQVWGTLPSSFLREQNSTENKQYVRQLHFITFTQDEKGDKIGITLFRSRDKQERFKFARGGDKVYGRALDYGGVEELFEAQAWTNYSEKRKMDMIDAASKTILKTTDKNLYARHPKGMTDMENLEMVVVDEGKDVGQLDTYPRNINLFNEWIAEWEGYAQRVGAATDPLLGEPAPSGTPFRAQERQVMEGKGLHEYRRGKFAKFIEEVYRDWILPHIVSKLRKGTKFLAELSADEMEWLREKVVKYETHRFQMEQTLAGKVFTRAEVDAYDALLRAEFDSKGNKRFFEILKGQLDGVELKIKVNVAGKQKDLALITDKLSRVLQQMLATYNPNTNTFAIFDDPRAAKVFSKIIEYSGLNPIDFSSLPRRQAQQQPLQQLQQVAQPTFNPQG